MVYLFTWAFGSLEFRAFLGLVFPFGFLLIPLHVSEKDMYVRTSGVAAQPRILLLREVSWLHWLHSLAPCPLEP